MNFEVDQPGAEPSEHLRSARLFEDTQSTNLSPPPSKSLEQTLPTSPDIPARSLSIDSGVPLGSTPVSALTQSPSIGLEKSKVPIDRAPFFSCDICKYVCGTSKALKSHITDKHRFSCQFAGCKNSFQTSATRDRHYRTRKHKTERNSDSPANIYRCHCGKGNERKDNHKRHLKTCKKLRTTTLQCECGLRDVTKEAHDAHLGLCIPKRNGSTETRANISTNIRR